MPANRPHYHPWLMAATGRIFYRVTRGFFTRQAAHKYAARRQPDPDKRIVLKCWEEKCAPRLD